MNYWAMMDQSILCIAINIFLVFRIIVSKEDDREMIALKRVLVFIILYTAFDCMLRLLENGPLQLPFIYIYGINLVYNISDSCLALSFFVYGQVIFSLHSEKKAKRKFKKHAYVMCTVFGLYTALVSLLTIFTYKTDLFLGRNGTNFNGFTYGPLDILWYISAFLPLMVTLVMAIRYCFDKNRFSYREKYLPIIAFGVLIAVTAVLQLLIDNSYSSIPMGITMAMIFLFITNSETKIFHDELTQTENRRQMYRDMQAYIDKGNKTWYLLIMDGDKFKSINDGFGHSEGDRALIKIADILKISCRKQNAKLYRVGGDEFIILKEVTPGKTEETDKEIEAFCKSITDRFIEYNASSGKLYKLMVTIGYARYGEYKSDSIRSLINRADKMLYARKGHDKR